MHRRHRLVFSRSWLSRTKVLKIYDFWVTKGCLQTWCLSAACSCSLQGGLTLSNIIWRNCLPCYSGYFLLLLFLQLSCWFPVNCLCQIFKLWQGHLLPEKQTKFTQAATKQHGFIAVTSSRALTKHLGMSTDHLLLPMTVSQLFLAPV